MNSNDKDKTIEELKKEVERKDKRINELEEENKELKKILTLFCNPHTPPSKQRLKKKTEEKIPKKIGAPKGHKGATREIPKPTKTEKHEILLYFRILPYL